MTAWNSIICFESPKDVFTLDNNRTDHLFLLDQRLSFWIKLKSLEQAGLV